MATPSLNGFEKQLKTGQLKVFLFNMCQIHIAEHNIRTNGNSSQTECEKLIFNRFGPISTQN